MSSSDDTTSAAQPPQQPSHPKLPAPFNASPSTDFTLISQGAEALLFKTTFLTLSTPVALKVRPPKPWRHALLDRRLTRQRILAEARVLVKSRREGVAVPAVLGLDWERGWVVTEWIEGRMAKEGIRLWSSKKNSKSGSSTRDEEKEDAQVERLKGLLGRIGRCIGKLHSTGVVHGDLTTSNMMIRDAAVGEEGGADKSESFLEGEIVLIDFGLAVQTVMDEDRAVDLYVLERAFGSTHPKEEDMFAHVLEAYAESFKGAKTVLRRLEDVRMRGRKKSMIG